MYIIYYWPFGTLQLGARQLTCMEGLSVRLLGGGGRGGEVVVHRGTLEVEEEVVNCCGSPDPLGFP